MLKRAGLGAAALAVPASVMATPAMGAVADALAADSFVKSHPKWKFVFVNHVTTNPFWPPLLYGAEDACSVLGCSYQWTGSKTSDISEMVNAFNAAITAKAAGIAVALVSLTAFNGPTNRALGKGIPVLAYNADAPNARLSYIGQDLYLSGYNMGQRVVDLVPSGDVALFIATPGQLNIQPRIDGLQAAIKKFGKGKIKTSVTATGALLPDELAKVEAYYLGHKGVKGMFAVDAGTTEAIDQQPYLQGWLPVLQLFFYKYSSGLVAPSDTNTGIAFVTKENVKPYLTTKTRYEGSSKKQKYPVTQPG
jgi:simple sugar transport system substrate-binding protein